MKHLATKYFGLPRWSGGNKRTPKQRIHSIFLSSQATLIHRHESKQEALSYPPTSPCLVFEMNTWFKVHNKLIIWYTCLVQGTIHYNAFDEHQYGSSSLLFLILHSVFCPLHESCLCFAHFSIDNIYVNSKNRTELLALSSSLNILKLLYSLCFSLVSCCAGARALIVVQFMAKCSVDGNEHHFTYWTRSKYMIASK